MINAILVDDEPYAIGNLSILLKRHCPQLHVVATAANSDEAVQAIQRYTPHIVFLDIEMPGESVFDMLQRLEQRDFELIFVTAFDHFALKAIKHDSTDYLLKPIDKEELVQAVIKATMKIQTKEALVVQANRSAEIHDAKAMGKVAIPSMEGILLIDTQDILYCEADGKYTRFHLSNTQIHVSSKNIGEYQHLFHQGFVRIHHHYIVNIKYIKKYVKGRGGFVVLQNGEILDVSVRRKEEFLHKLRI